MVSGAQRIPKRDASAVPTGVISASVTPKERAERPTCWIKYVISALERAINLWTWY